MCRKAAAFRHNNKAFRVRSLTIMYSKVTSRCLNSSAYHSIILLTSIHQLVFPSGSLHHAPAVPATQPTCTSKFSTEILFKLWPQGSFAFVQPAARWSSPSVSRSVFRSSYAHSMHTARTAPSSRPVRRHSHSLPHSSSISHALTPPQAVARTYPPRMHTTWPSTSTSP